MARVYFKVMADYDCWPLWREGVDFANVDPESLPLSGALRQDLTSWADRYDRTLVRDDPASSQFESPDVESQFHLDGARLAARANDELAEIACVRYWREAPHLALELREADELIVVSGSSYDHAHRKNNDVLVSTQDPAEIGELLEAVSFAPGRGYMDWMTLASSTVVALRERIPLAALGLIGTDFVRCEALWDGDAPVSDPARLLAWLTRHGAALS